MIRTCHKISKKNDNLVSIAVMAGRVAKRAYQRNELLNFKIHFGEAEMETPDDFCPSRFSQVCLDFHFLQNANLHSDEKI